jgi:peptide/nickel transport system substrate-binding protein
MGARIKIIVAVAVVLVVGLVVVLVVTGSGSDGEQAGQAGAGGSPKYGGTLVVAGADPGALNPAITSAGTTHPVTGQIFNGLVRLDRNMEPQPDLARSFEESDDGLTYTFKLRPGVRWHDGRPFSSADVKFTFEEVLLDLHPRTRALADSIESIETPDDLTVVFRLKERYTPFLKLVDEDNGAILPRHLYEGTDPLTNPANAEPVGTGPFKFESAVTGSRINLVRNEEYFKEGRPYLDRIVFRIIARPPQAFQAFQAGEVNFLGSPSPPDVERLSGQDGVGVTEEGREGFGRVIRLIPNLEREPFDDVRVRRAMAHAIDRDFIARTAYAGTLDPATGPITSALPPFYTDDVEDPTYDPARAQELLDEAGLEPDEDGVRFQTSLIFDQGFAPTAEILRQQLGEVGIELDLEVLEFNAWVNRLYIEGDFELGYSQLTDPPDPEIGTRRVFTCANRVPVPFANGAGYCNERVDELFEQAASEPDESRRVELYGEIQQIIVREQPHIFLVDGIGPYAYDADFAGFENAGAKATYYFGDTAWWTQGSESREE